MKKGMSKNATVNPSTAAVPKSQHIREDSQYIAEAKTPLREKLKGFGKNVTGRCARALELDTKYPVLIPTQNTSRLITSVLDWAAFTGKEKARHIVTAFSDFLFNTF